MNLGQPHEHNTPAVEIAHVTYGEFFIKMFIIIIKYNVLKVAIIDLTNSCFHIN